MEFDVEVAVNNFESPEDARKFCEPFSNPRAALWKIIHYCAEHDDHTFAAECVSELEKLEHRGPYRISCFIAGVEVWQEPVTQT